MTDRRAIALLLAVAFALAVAVGACAPEEGLVEEEPTTEPADGKRGGTLVFGRLQEPETLDIHRTPWLDELMYSMQATLLNRAEDGLVT
ncbi:MAG: hypothetical protein R6U70_03225 [Bacillota bacterium]